ncbi:hypothetical protein BEP19_00850 [Ammoniphilus oxalaticus]|uniref:Prepilin-type N-terminal cleavage/methylation domain-containing protein n=1 Tax=Ammoniphilus oxalaticus TaxID=66863 RepID=A0A419SMJ8_9BACL|nr:hypothetical protein [Ammoniphilus oxalaticus]RKD25526.1 hypothetical protein BEP19_00850 [Ammoniphilus oxalaticus]
MNDERGFCWFELVIVLLTISVLLTVALPLYGALSKQLSRTAAEWDMFWEMKQIGRAWQQGTVAAGSYKRETCEIEIKERLFDSAVVEGEVTIRWQTIERPYEKTQFVYKMVLP